MNTIATQIDLLLAHIIATFRTKMAVLWFTDMDTFYASINHGSSTERTNMLASFFAGYYSKSMRIQNRKSPIIIDNIYNLHDLPERISRLAEVENIRSLLLSPVMHNGHVKGMMLLAAENIKVLHNINFQLLTLLGDFALYLNEMDYKRPECEVDEKNISRIFGSIIGKSPQMRELFKAILKIAQCDASVFICGESGTGKELVARTIHSLSARKEQAFIPVDCVALPESLLESELFGFEKGAFTGANSFKRGLIEYANHGTFFLDEIAEMHFELQAKLLRVLQERKFRRIGGNELLDIDIRVISATNRNPKEAIAQRLLREDLYYRLNVIPIFIPPLRERKEDIPPLVEHFVRESVLANDRGRLDISDTAMEKLMHFNWPGNVRELRNLIERVVALSQNCVLTIDDFPEEIVHYEPERRTPVTLPYNEAKEQSLMAFEKTYFSGIIDKYNGNISKVAKEANVSRKTVYNVLKKHNLNGFSKLTLK